MKVIIADDSAVIRAILDQNLTKYPDVEIIASVSNGRRAVQAARGEHIDAVISDIDMPEMTGLEAAKILSSERKQENRGKTRRSRRISCKTAAQQLYKRIF